MELNAKTLKGFREYLESQKIEQKTINEIFRNTVKYLQVLLGGNASELAKFSMRKRKQAMKALAAFSKYCGCYERWQNIRRGFQLKWTSIDSLSGFNNFLNQEADFGKMIVWIKNAINNSPRFSNISKFNVLTGLISAEAIESFNLLLNLKKNGYVSKDRKILEYFRYPSVFLIRTKKAFIFVVDEDILKLIKNSQNDVINCDKIRSTFLLNNQ